MSSTLETTLLKEPTPENKRETLISDLSTQEQLPNNSHISATATPSTTSSVTTNSNTSSTTSNNTSPKKLPQNLTAPTISSTTPIVEIQEEDRMFDNKFI